MKKDGATFFNYVERFPEPKRSHDPLEMNSRIAARHSAQNVVQFMLERPEAAGKIWERIQSGVIVDLGKTSGAVDASAGYDLAISGKSVLKLHWKVKAAQLASMPGGPTVTLLDQVNDKDKYALHDIFGMCFQYRKSDKVPEKITTQQEFTVMNKVRLQTVGFDIAAWFGASVDDDGTVDWNAKPLFTPEYDTAGYLVKVWFANSGEYGVVPEGMWIGQECKFVDGSPQKMHNA